MEDDFCTVHVHSSAGIQDIMVKKGANLLSVLQEHHYSLYAPCGGQGTCGKCKLHVTGAGWVTSCLYHIEEDISVAVPDMREMEVMVAQHRFTRQVTFNPGKIAEKFPFSYGMAIDIGTTTMAFYLINMVTGSVVDVHSAINPQLKFGADVISRINYCITNSNGINQLQKLTIGSINQQIEKFAQEFNIHSTLLTKFTIAGNTTMLHILAGENPVSLALAPFTPVFTEHRIMTGEEAGLKANPEAEVHLLPSVSAYVGADILAGLVSLYDADIPVYLYIDIGTNGEMALVTREKVWCCATAAGPAFEGANITYGMGAFEGAINKYGKDGYTTIAHAGATGICGSGLVDIIAYLLDTRKISNEGLLEESFVVSPASFNAIENDILINQQDVREIQLAKGAVAAGMQVLMKKAGLSFDDIDALFIAGGFGNYLDVERAMQIGLIPREMSGRAIQIGNAAGSGAVLALKSVQVEKELRQLGEKIEYIELSYDEDFPVHFAMEMNFRDS